MMATLKDVARMANVDTSTVSRALNNASHVHPSTKARILGAAKKLGYRPNVVAKWLKEGRTYIIGIVVPRIQLTLFAEIIQGVEKEARRRGYSVIICSSSDDPILERSELKRLHNGLVDGVIIAGTGQNGDILQDMKVWGIAITQVVRLQEYGLSSVVADYEACSRQAVQYLVSKGCSKIGLINGPLELWPYRERLEGYKQITHQFGLSEISTSSTQDCNSFEYGYRCTMNLLKQEPDLDALMVAVDIQGMGAMRALQELGISYPGHVRLVSLTGHFIGSLLETQMTAMEIPATEMGEKAASMVIEDIEAPLDAKPTRQHLVFPPILVERQSG
jgi:LacI family transcriptional regulator